MTTTQTLDYIAISKNMSKKFKKHDYVISSKIEKDGNFTFIKSTVLRYGYKQASTYLGSARGWNKINITQFIEDFNNEFEQQTGVIKVKDLQD